MLPTPCLVFLLLMVSTVSANEIRSAASSSKTNAQLRMFTACDDECFTIVNRRAEAVSVTIVTEKRKWGLVDVLDLVADLSEQEENNPKVAGITAKIMQTIVASFHALYDNSVPNMRALLLKRWAVLKKSSEEVAGSLESQNWVVWKEMKRATQESTMKNVRPFCQLLPSMRVGGGLLVSMSVDIPLAGICALGINFCLGRAFAGFQKLLRSWLKEPATVASLGAETVNVVAKLLFAPLARGLDYLQSATVAPHLSGILLRLAQWVKSIILSNAGENGAASHVMEELNARIATYGGDDGGDDGGNGHQAVCGSTASPLCVASQCIQLISMLLDPVVIKTTMLNFGVKLLGYQVKAIQQFIMGENTLHPVEHHEESAPPGSLRFIEIGNAKHSLQKFYLSHDTTTMPPPRGASKRVDTLSTAGRLRFQKLNGRQYLSSTADCTGLDLLTTVLCAVNAKAASIRKNHQEQSQVDEGAGEAGATDKSKPVTEWTPTELLATRNLEVITNHPDYGYGTQAGMFSVIGASFHWLFDSFVPDFRSLAMDKYSDFRHDLMVLASDGGAVTSPEGRAKVVQQMGTLFKGNDFSIVGEMRSSLVELTSPMIEGLCALVPNFSVGVNVGVATTDVEVPVRALCVGALNWGIIRMFRSLVRVLKHFLEDFTKTSPAITDLIATNPLASEFLAMLPKLLFQSVGESVEGIVDIEHYTAQLKVFPEIVTAIAKGIDDADTTSDEFETLKVEMEQAVSLHLHAAAPCKDPICFLDALVTIGTFLVDVRLVRQLLLTKIMKLPKKGETKMWHGVCKDGGGVLHKMLCRLKLAVEKSSECDWSSGASGMVGSAVSGASDAAASAYANAPDLGVGSAASSAYNALPSMPSWS